MQPVDRIRQLLSTPLDPWVAGAFAAYLEGHANGLTLDECFGITVSPERRLKLASMRRRYRNACIRWLAKHSWPELSTNKQAAKVHAQLMRYEKGRWRFDRHDDFIPHEYLGEGSEILFRILNASKELGTAIPSARQLRRILAIKRPPNGQKLSV